MPVTMMLTGTIAGTPVVLVEARSLIHGAAGDGPYITMSSLPQVCDRLGDSHHARGERRLEIQIHAIGGGVFAGNVIPVLDPINAQSSGGSTAGAGLIYYDDSCNPVIVNDYAASGTLTIADIDSRGTSGYVDINFRDGHVTGSFVAPVCTLSGGQSPLDCPDTPPVDAGNGG